MVLGWRRAFCTSIPRDQDRDSVAFKEKSDPSPSPKLSSKISGLFSNPSTPRLQSQPVSSPSLRCRTTAFAATTPAAARPTAGVRSTSAPQSPKLHCKTDNGTRFFHRSTPSSPRSPSTFSLIKSSLRLSKSRCGICFQNVKTGQGTAIFTAECSHSFHFPCLAAHVKKQGSLTCPICNSTWKEMHLLANDNKAQDQRRSEASAANLKNEKKSVLKVYNDDEPLASPTSGARFNPIPESDEENEEFPGFFANGSSNAASPVVQMDKNAKNVEFRLPEAVVVSVGRSSEIRTVVLKMKAPPAPSRIRQRAPIDLVTVLDVSGRMTNDKLQMMKKAMRLIVSSLSADDRLSIVAFSTTSKRLLPLRRMTTSGRRSARRILEAVVALGGVAASPNDALKKAAKVIEDRREKNPAVSIILLSDGHSDRSFVSSTRFSAMEIPVHSVSLSYASACLNSPNDDAFSKCIRGLLNVVVQDLDLQLGFISGSAPAEISAVYSYIGRPACLGSGSDQFRVGDLYAEEERELLIELKVPSSLAGSHHVLSVRCAYKDPSTQEPVHCREQALLIPRSRAIRSSTPEIKRLRNLFITTRAVAESRRLIERSDLTGAHRMLVSARALLLQSGHGSGDEFICGLDAELAELNWRRQNNQVQRRKNAPPAPVNNIEVAVEEKTEPVTPTSAWRAAERLAKVAIMRKTLNRVSDLHGFEDARF